MSQSPEAVWLEKNWSMLPENEWVAVGKDGLVAHAPKFDELIEKLRSIDAVHDVLFAFVPFRNVIMQ
jgi:hypothetical protein